jgi:hypothetical protein
VTPRSDNLVEGDETVILTVNDGFGYAVGSVASDTLTITDDPPVVTVAKTSDAKEDGSLTGQFTFTRTGGNRDLPLTVSYTVDGTATAGLDYEATTGVVNFAPGSTTATVDITPKIDNIVDGDETVILTISPGGTAYTVGSSNSDTLTITDSPPVVKVSAWDAAAAGLIPGGFEIAHSGGDLSQPLTVPFTIGGTAVFGQDYTLSFSLDSLTWTAYTTLPTSVTIPANSSSLTLRVTPLLINNVSADKTVTLTTADGGTNYLISSQNPATVTIAENNPPVVTVTNGRDAAEPNGNGLFLLQRTRSGGDISQPLTANFTVGGTAVNGSDYDLLVSPSGNENDPNAQIVQNQVTFTAGQSTVYLWVRPHSDNDVEGNSTVVLTLSAGTYQIGQTNSASLTITEDPPVVSWENSQNGAEPNQNGSFVLSRHGGDTSQPLTVYYSVGGTAVAGTNYQALPTQITFNPGQTEATIPVVVRNDGIPNNDTTVQLTLADGNYQIGSTTSSTITIADGQSANLSLTLDKTTINEGDSVSLSGTFNPTGSGTQYTMAIDWGDGTTTGPENVALTGSQISFSSLNHTYFSDGKHNVVVTFSNPDGSIAAKNSIDVTVNNVGPLAVILSDEVNPDGRQMGDPRGVLVALTIAVEDFDPNDTYRLTIDWGDNTAPTVITAATSVSFVNHTYEVGASGLELGTKTFTINVTATDNEPNDPKSMTGQVILSPFDEQPPVLSFNPLIPSTSNEGDTVTVTGTLGNPGTSTNWGEVTIDWGDGSSSTVPLNPPTTDPTSPDYVDPTSRNYSTALTFTATHKYVDESKSSSSYTVFAKALTASGSDTTLTATTEVPVKNVAPSGLKLTPKVDSTQNTITFTQGSFTDPGVNDSHTVTINWGDGTTTQFSLGAGVLSFTSDQFPSALAHQYGTLAGTSTSIVVTVQDNGPAPNTSRVFYRIDAPSPGNVLTTYDKDAEQVTSGSVADIFFSFASRLFDIVANSASQFVYAVGKFVEQLSALEANLTQLFGTTVPKFLSALLDDPGTFIDNLLTVASKAFGEFFDPNTLPTTLQQVLFSWVSDKAANLDIPVTPADFPTDPSNAGQVAGFALKAMGLTWDDLVARVATRIGPDNLQLLAMGYNYVSQFLSDDSQLGFLNAIPKIAANFNIDVTNFNADQLTDQAFTAIKTTVTNVLSSKLGDWAAKALNPLDAGFGTLIDVAGWLLNNIDKVNKLVGIINTLGEQIDNIAHGEINTAKDAVKDALKNAAPIALDLAATVLGVDDIPQKIFGAIGSLKGKLDSKIDAVIGAVVGIVTKQLQTLLNGIPVPAGQKPDYTGLVGNVMTFKSGSDQHRLWAVVNSGSGKFTLASNPDDLSKSEALWKQMAQTDPQMQKLYNTEQLAEAAVLKALSAAAAASTPLQNDLKQQPPTTAKAKAAAEAATRTDAKAFATNTNTLINQETAQQPTSPPTTFPASVSACLGYACFVPGTPMLVPGGAKPIEQFRAGDLILSRSEFDPTAPVEAKVVEEVFVRRGRVLNLHVGGQVIGTTAEHPFYAEGRGWVLAGELHAGDRVATLTGELVVVEETYDTGVVEAVYNLRIADHHTYFVGCDEWGFAAWAHNQYLEFEQYLLRYGVDDHKIPYDKFVNMVQLLRAKQVPAASDILKSILSSSPFSLSNASQVAGNALTALLAPDASAEIADLKKNANWATNQSAIEQTLARLAQKALLQGASLSVRPQNNFVYAEALLYGYATEVDLELQGAESKFGVVLEPAAMAGSRGVTRMPSWRAAETDDPEVTDAKYQNLWGYISDKGTIRLDIGLVDRTSTSALPPVLAGFDISYKNFKLKPFVGYDDQAAFGSIPIYDVRIVGQVATAYRLDQDGKTINPPLPS